MKAKLLVFLLLITSLGFAQEVKKEIKITKRYLNLPVEGKADRQKMTFEVNGKEVRNFVIRLSQGQPDYWVFADVSAYKGEILAIGFPAKTDGLDKIYQSDQIAGTDSLYKERNRPQFHFTTKRGWNNDPNGLVYYKGEYHLFYQHNPFEIDWENMTWGHAVSKDLIHWKELSPALYPDELGAMFSGSAIVDFNNATGFQTGNEKVLVAVYTTAGKSTQCIAFSNDKGRIWTKYTGNPIINSKTTWANSTDSRDPKIFWYDAAKKWVMVLYEKNGISIYNSDNLKEWTYQSHIAGFYNCPELFQLPVDNNPASKKWVLYSGSGTYLIGNFDGGTFKPTSEKRAYFSGKMYAAQTFNDVPASDGRRIQIGWGQIIHPEMPFNQMMTFPTQLSLRSTADGIRLFSEPLAEINKLHKKGYKWRKANIKVLNEELKQIKGDLFHLKINVNGGVLFGLQLDGQAIFDSSMVKQLNNGLYNGKQSRQKITFEILVDKTSVEVFADRGRYSFIEQRKAPLNNQKGFSFANESDLIIDNLEIFELNTIW